jgi:hypothetical protein
VILISYFFLNLAAAAAGIHAAVPEPGRGGEAALPEPAPTWAQPDRPCPPSPPPTGTSTPLLQFLFRPATCPTLFVFEALTILFNRKNLQNFAFALSMSLIYLFRTEEVFFLEIQHLWPVSQRYSLRLFFLLPVI